MNDLLLPPGTRLLHIGPHKTGTTALQAAMHENRDALGAYGVHYAGRADRPRRAGWAIGLRGRPAGSTQPDISYWQNLVADVAAAGDARVVISNEDFGRATAEQRDRIVADLGGGRPHVVAAVRRLDTYLPSQWQERIKAGEPTSYEDWLRLVLADPDLPYSWDKTSPGYHWERTNVWYAHDPAALAARWAEAVGAENVTLVLLDETDRGALTGAFEQLLGLPDGLLPTTPRRTNRSLTWAEVELIRQVNERLIAAGVTRAQRRTHLTAALELLADRTPAAGRKAPPLPARAAQEVRDLAATRLDSLAGLGVRVIGDPGGLLGEPDVTDQPLSAPTVDTPTAAAVLAAAVIAARDATAESAGA